MKYFILCPYCNKTYIVDGENQTSFTCPNCGASNKHGDIVSTEDDTEKIRRAAEEIVREKEERRNKLERLYQQEDEQKRQRSDRQEPEEESSSGFSSNNANPFEEWYAFDKKDIQDARVPIVVIISILLIIFFIDSVRPHVQKPPVYTTKTDSKNSITESQKQETKKQEDKKQEEQKQEEQKQNAAEIYSLKDKIVDAIASGDSSKLLSCFYGFEYYQEIPLSDWQALFQKYYGQNWGDPAFNYKNLLYPEATRPPNAPHPMIFLTRFLRLRILTIKLIL